MKEKKFNCHAFGAIVWATYGSREDLEKWAENKHLPSKDLPNIGYDAFVQTISNSKNGLRVYHIHLEKPQDFYSLLHETTHLTNRIFEDRDIFYNRQEDEVFAYYQTYWFKRLWRYYGKIETGAADRKPRDKSSSQ